MATDRFPAGDPPQCVAPDGTRIYSRYRNTSAYRADGSKWWELTDRSFATCAVAKTGIFYLTSENRLSALDSAGRVLWEMGIDEGPSAPAVAADGTVYLTTRSCGGLQRTLFAISPAGVVKWKFFLPGRNCGSTGTPAVIAADGTIYVYARDGPFDERSVLYALSPAGKLKWTLEPPKANILGMVIGPSENIYIHRYGGIVAVSPAGKILWQYDSPAGMMEGDMVAAADGTLYVLSTSLRAISPEGKQKWEIPPGDTSMIGDYFAGNPILGEDGTIYAATYHQLLYAVTPQGKIRWLLTQAPTFNQRKDVHELMLAGDGIFQAGPLRLQVGGGLMRGGWPCARHDNENSGRAGRQ